MASGVTGEKAHAATVLIVDDDEGYVGALRRILGREAYRVLTTTDPRQVMDLIAKEHVDVLLSDVEMPFLNGFDLIAKVKATYPHVLRLLLTGRASLGSALQAINEGEVFRFLTKPCSNEDLIKVLREAVARAQELPGSKPSVPSPGMERRSQLLEAIEIEHPGLTHVENTDGIYRIEQSRIGATLDRLGSAVLNALWKD